MIEGPLRIDHLSVYLLDEGVTIINIYRPLGEDSRGYIHLDLLAISA